LKQIAQSTCWFFGGWFFAVPILFRGRLQDYLNSTVYNTSHGADNLDLGVINWIELINDQYFPVFLMTPVFILLFIFLTFKNLRLYKSRGNPELGLSLLAFSLILPIIFKVHRMWGFYLHNGFTFLMVFFLVMASKEPFKWRPWNLNLVTLFLLGLLCTAQIPNRFAEFKALSERSKTAEHQQKLHEYRVITDYLRSLPYRKEVITVFYDPALYIPSSNNQWLIKPIWGYFSAWLEGPDVVVVGPGSIPSSTESLSKGNVEYDKALASMKQLEDHLVKDGKCSVPPCYVLANKVGENVRVLVKL